MKENCQYDSSAQLWQIVAREFPRCGIDKVFLVLFYLI